MVGLQFQLHDQQEHKNAIVPLRKWMTSQFDSIILNLKQIQAVNEKDQRIYYYSRSREYYKHIEFFLETVSPKEARLYINGPLVPKYENELSSEMIEPMGFQVLESLIFMDEKPELTLLETEITHMEEVLERLRSYYSTIDLTDYVVLEMLQLQLYRIASMGLNGYDATISLTALKEIAWSLDGIKMALSFYGSQNTKNKSRLIFKSLNLLIKEAREHLTQGTNYYDFDRLEFILKYINPLNKKMVKYHRSLELPWNTNKQALDLQSGSLFNEKSFDKRYFSIYYETSPLEPLQAALGKKLFNDPLLSGNNKVSCSTCHFPDLSFTDGLPKARAIDGQGFVDRNTPTLLNVVFQKSFFHDGRTFQLEGQAEEVIVNPKEMRSNFADIILKLKKSPDYIKLFQKAFYGTPDTAITQYAIKKAITEYEKTLTSFNSRFDQFIKGDKKALSLDERNGYNVFAGKALCGSCHFFPLFNGTVPPLFNKSEFEVIGVPESVNAIQVDEDLGHFFVTHTKAHRHSFKTPTIRNIEYTSPYMHNGVFNTLEQVVDFYHKGGGVGIGLDIPNQTLPFDSLQLSVKEKKDLVLFMKSLSDQTYNR
ncbi:MAG: cytochrome-c peroxidase [Flavobacteriales bacterium]|nr:cytochrome-c peroxidase [Flavobacteriales bacterium]